MIVFDVILFNYVDILQEIDSSNGFGVLRKFLSKNEIKNCNQLVKLGYLSKGKSDEKNGSIAFFITKEGENFLEEN